MTERGPWVLGVSNSHNGAVCLLEGDRIVAAVQEERLVRRKRQRIYGAKPSLALTYCLEQAGIKASNLSMVVYCSQASATSPDEDMYLNPVLQPQRNRIPVVRISHHLAHAVSAFATSGFRESAILVVDGMGSPWKDLSEDEVAGIKTPVEQGWETISLYFAEGTAVRALEKHLVTKGQWLTWEFTRMPRFQSLGGIFSAAAWQIFGNHHEAGKVMGLAPYGRPEIPASDFFHIVDGRFEYCDAVPRRFQHIDRWPKRQSEYQDLASSCQTALEEALLYLGRRARELCPSGNLSYAGGVALNSVANERLIRESGYEQVYIIPAAEDSGPAIGAAYYGLFQLTGKNTARRLVHDSVGRPYPHDTIAKTLDSTPGIRVTEPLDVLEETIDLLCANKIVGWFQGGSELGPRALGQRSILCDPRSPDAKSVLNTRVKHREPFRPFAPVIPLEEAANWFDLEGFPAESPFMLRICRFQEDKKNLVPAVVHVDGTGRFQTLTREANGPFYDLVQRFHRRTGVPILLNTSYNVMGEPIVETPEDAVWCFLSTGIDACVLEDRLVTKAPDFRSILDFRPSIVAPRFSQSRLLGEGWSDSDGAGAYLTFPVRGPFGPAVQLVSPNALPVLALINGRMTGWDILERLPKLTGAADEHLLLRTLKEWQTSAGGQSFLESTITPLDVVETLLHDRETAYTEAALTRILIRLRRSNVIAFHAPQAAASSPMPREVESAAV